VLFTVDAKDDAMSLHRPEDLAADPLVHGDAVFGVRRAVGRVVFAGSEETRLRAGLDHCRRRLSGEVKGDDELVKGVRSRLDELFPIRLDRPCRFRVRSGDTRDGRPRVRHRERSCAAHREMVGDVESHIHPLAEVGMEIIPFREREFHVWSLS